MKPNDIVDYYCSASIPMQATHSPIVSNCENCHHSTKQRHTMGLPITFQGQTTHTTILNICTSVTHCSIYLGIVPSSNKPQYKLTVETAATALAAKIACCGVVSVVFLIVMSFSWCQVFLKCDQQSPCLIRACISINVCITHFIQHV